MMPVISPVYAAVAALFYFALSVNTVRVRRLTRIPIGDGGDERMLRAIRIHGNFIEYVPLTLILILMMELEGVLPLFVHGAGICLLAGRLVHAYGVSRRTENFRFREAGMAFTFVALLGAACLLIETAVIP